MNSIPPFNLLTKPTGPVCNLDCTYCYYLEKEKMYPGNNNFVMNETTLETFVRKYNHFVWQGGEPTLLGIDYFKKHFHFRKNTEVVE
ncbi:hypothetical protein C3K47_08745 [Solitalea longa]|uniref:Anaerobic sulfatase maturase n=1 Tax=Solitalea longa TaxID=2079460 RepID=A0A2S5A3L5_9SPHI|nr:hypothetical protein [Solitalea longa]POY37135.1 hypothetical protein C3K47_08745 [Solitalea longa]